MRRKGARILSVSAAQALGNVRLLGGPLRLCGWSLNDGAIGQGLQVNQSAAAPAAGATIASISLGNGAYLVEWVFELTGTPGAGDVDNVQLFVGATLLDTSVNLGAVGNYSQEEVEAQVVFGPLTLAWKALGAATAGTTYKVSANIISQGNAGGTIFDGGQSVAFPNMPQGSAQTFYYDKYGVQVDTQISVQTTLGTIQGVLYYYLDSDLDDEGDPNDDYGG